jgi:hypothetical protein
MVADSMPLTYLGASNLPQIVRAETLNQNKVLTIRLAKKSARRWMEHLGASLPICLILVRSRRYAHF